MQYVRNLSGSVAKTWNSINPATLSGAIDVIVVEQSDGMHGSPLELAPQTVQHVRNCRWRDTPQAASKESEERSYVRPMLLHACYGKCPRAG